MIIFQATPERTSRFWATSVDEKDDSLAKTLVVAYVYQKEVGWPKQLTFALPQTGTYAADT